MAEKPEKTLSFEYKISSNYTTYRITGLHGGITAQGDVVASVFHERGAIPKMETYELKANGSLGNSPISEEKKSCIIRDVMFAVSMNPNAARDMGKWFIARADEFDEAFKVKDASK